MIFSDAEKAAVYKAIHTRRDVRSQFLKNPISDDTLQKILNAAHAAPSVGYMQPWDFIIIKNKKVKTQVKDIFDLENTKAALNYSDSRKNLYQSLKLEGILDAPINICITCDRKRGEKHILGKNSMPEMDLFSTCLAVQNLWLAARTEGIGVGWVSILDNAKLAKILNLPENIYPVAYLCVGYVSEFFNSPELETVGWNQKLPLQSLIHIDK